MTSCEVWPGKHLRGVPVTVTGLKVQQELYRIHHGKTVKRVSLTCGNKWCVNRGHIVDYVRSPGKVFWSNRDGLFKVFFNGRVMGETDSYPTAQEWLGMLQKDHGYVE